MISDTLNTTNKLQNSSNYKHLYFGGGNFLMKPINIQIPDELYDAVKDFAKEHNLSMAEVVRIALRKYIYPEGSSKTLTITDILEQINQLQKRLEEIETHVRHTQTLTPKRTTTLHSQIAATNTIPQPSHNKNQKTKPITTITTRQETTLKTMKKPATSRSMYETLVLNIMKEEPTKIWSLNELFEQIMNNYGEDLIRNNIELKKDSLKDRIARMVRNGVIKKIGRGRYALK